MVWCNYCSQDQVADVDETNGFTCCTGCGQVLEDTAYSTDPTFTKGAGGQVRLVIDHQEFCARHTLAVVKDDGKLKGVCPFLRLALERKQ